MNFTWKIEFISPIQLVGEKQHKKQYFIISDEKGEYPNKLKIEAFNKSEEMEGLKIGEVVEVLYNANVKEYKEKALSLLEKQMKDAGVKTFETERLKVTRGRKGYLKLTIKK